MGLYNFQKQFVPFVESGTKTHTIRAKRKITPKVGETLHLYTGLRQKGARLLMRVPCTKVEEILIEEAGRCTEYRDGDHRIGIIPKMTVNGEVLATDEMEALARRDGFPDLFEMMGFWWGRLPFEGHIIHWKPEVQR